MTRPDGVEYRDFVLADDDDLTLTMYGKNGVVELTSEGPNGTEGHRFILDGKRTKLVVMTTTGLARLADEWEQDARRREADPERRGDAANLMAAAVSRDHAERLRRRIKP